jgi:hypothetical protein
MGGNAWRRGGTGAAGSSMACKRSGVQIPSAPPQVRGPIRPRPPRNLPPRAADRQQSALPRAIRHQLAARSPGHVGPPPVPVPRRVTGSARQFDGEPAASSLSGFSTRACFGRIATATCATMHRWRPLRAARFRWPVDQTWTKPRASGRSCCHRRLERLGLPLDSSVRIRSETIPDAGPACGPASRCPNTAVRLRFASHRSISEKGEQHVEAFAVPIKPGK